MSLSEKFVSIEELAAATNRTPHWYRRHHRRLHREAGMPEKSALGWLWPRKALERWIDGEGVAHRGEAAPDAAGQAVAEANTIAANQNRDLRARYAGRAHA